MLISVTHPSWYIYTYIHTCKFKAMMYFQDDAMMLQSCLGLLQAEKWILVECNKMAVAPLFIIATAMRLAEVNF